MFQVSFEVGQIVGDYEVLGVLGRGGMGAVYRVRNVLSHREEAMKIALHDAHYDPQTAERFLREIRVQASLRHPNIAELRTAVRVGDHALMILELIDGESVDAKLKRGPLRFDLSFRVIDDILSALSYAHQRGVIHRDIKPANIMVTSRGLIKLTDFGIARASNEKRITETHVAVGSLHYMAPEQILSNKLDERSDLYSLGITFYEMLTGRLPVDGKTPFELMDAHMNRVPVPPAELVPGLDPEVSKLVLKALAKSPSERYPTAQAFQAALRDALFGDNPTVVMPPTAPGQSHPPSHSHRSSHTPPPIPPHTPIPPNTPSPPAIPASDLHLVERYLALAIGPIAKSLVHAAAGRHSSLASLCQDLATRIPSPGDRAAFLRAAGVDSEPKRDTGPSVASRTSATRLTPAAIETARKALAEHVGPMAAVIVSRAVKRVSSVEELSEVLSAELPDERAKTAFRTRLKI